MATDVTIISWNVENLARWLDGDALAQRVRALGEPDVLCLQETRVRPGDASLIAAMQSAVPGYSCHAAFANDRFNVTFRGGRQHGVVTYVRESLGQVVSATPAWDREGRVVVTAIPDHRLAVINLYAVNGTSKPYRDPETGAAAGDRHAFKRAFQARLLDLADELRASAGVILAGDWNVSRTPDDVTPRLRTSAPHARARAELNERFARDGWVDVFRALHPDARRYSWFGRTRTGALDAARVDYIVVASELVDRVRAADILDDRAQRPHSDHAPLAVELAI
jgi:exodeoxyribonuclease-3